MMIETDAIMRYESMVYTKIRRRVSCSFRYEVYTSLLTGHFAIFKSVCRSHVEDINISGNAVKTILRKRLDDD